jgi:hypothetical protein
VQLVAPEILAIRLIRRAAEKGREILDRMDIASLVSSIMRRRNGLIASRWSSVIGVLLSGMRLKTPHPQDRARPLPDSHKHRMPQITARAV